MSARYMVVAPSAGFAVHYCVCDGRSAWLPSAECRLCLPDSFVSADVADQNEGSVFGRIGRCVVGHEVVAGEPLYCRFRTGHGMSVACTRTEEQRL